MADNNLLQKLVDSNYTLVHIKTDDTDRILDIFQRFNHETGCAVYNWQKNNGLHRVGFEHILIPRTKSDADLANYIRTARHFGIYFLSDFQQSLDKGIIQEQINEITQKKDGVRRLLAIIGDEIKIPKALQDITCTIVHNQEAQKPIEQTQEPRKQVQKPSEQIHNLAAASGY